MSDDYQILNELEGIFILNSLFIGLDPKILATILNGDSKSVKDDQILDNSVNISDSNNNNVALCNSLSQTNNNFSTGRWMPDEHKRFVEAIIKFGNDWKKVQLHVRTRSSTQARSHAQKFFYKIKKTDILDNPGKNNSIKQLHEKVGVMEETEYNKTITKLNQIAFDKKSPNLKMERVDSTISILYDHISPERKPNLPSSIINTEADNLFLSKALEGPPKEFNLKEESNTKKNNPCLSINIPCDQNIVKYIIF